MLYLGTNPLAGNIKQKLFTVSGTFVVPDDVQMILVDAVGGGAGGGGGHTSDTTGGGGGGGSSGCQFVQFPIPVASGETLTVTVGAGGGGGAAGANGSASGRTQVIGSLGGLYMPSSGQGDKGTATIGGDSNGYGATHGISSTTAGVSSYKVNFQGIVNTLINNYVYLPRYVGASEIVYQAGAGGGGPGYNGGVSAHGPALIATAQTTDYGCRYVTGGTGSGAAGSGLGGGGAGGSSFWGEGGLGGNAGAAGGNATGYGCGGGGGGCNAAGGNGSPGFVRIYYISKYTVA